MLQLIQLLLLLFLVTLADSSENNLYVKIKQGTLLGKLWTSKKGRVFTGFTGIPYAKPPINELRFNAPVGLDAWDGILNATGLHPICPQQASSTVIGNEDCLYLNVYTPSVPSNNTRNPLFSVLFYIHGGSFLYNGASPDWLGPEIMMDKDIVLVTINYRLGPLGFLSTGDDVVPGNNGLKDQTLALKWVKRNIEHFGGNSNKITLVGNSAGSASVELHMISPLTKGLFHGAILQSGPLLSPFTIGPTEEAVNNMYRLAEFLNCTTSEVTELVECLRKVNFRDMILQLPKFMFWGGDLTVSSFRPVVESEGPDAFISKHPKDILNTTEVVDIPVLIGLVGQEAAYQAAEITTDPILLKEFNENFDTIIRREFSFSFSFKNDNYVESIKAFYFNNQEITHMTKLPISEMYTDGIMLWESDYTVRAHLYNRKSPIYLYLFDYVGSVSYVSLIDNSGYPYGVCHTDELFYLLPRTVLFPNYVPTESDSKVADLMTTLWSNFVHHSNPTPTKNLNITTWSPVSSNDLEFYHIKSSTNQAMETKLFAQRLDFWRSSLNFS